MKYVIITGMSGAGKSTALRYLEDMGYFCVDNLPVPLLKSFFELTEGEGQGHEKVALGMDIRNGKFLRELSEVTESLKGEGRDITTVFMDADDAVLVKRYKETRHAHPLTGAQRLEVGIARERVQVSFLRENADYIIDTSQLLTRELNAVLCDIFRRGERYGNMFVSILSFGFKYGIPADADLVFDVRFLPNPYYVANLRPKTGNDREVCRFVTQVPEAGRFLDKLEDMIRFLIPNYIREGKNQLVVAIGCTGGRHRSVTLSNMIYGRLQENGNYGLRVEHRDLEKARRL